MVRHGNSLTQEMWEHRPTPQLRYFNQDLRRYRAVEAMRQLIVNPAAYTDELSTPNKIGSADTINEQSSAELTDTDQDHQTLINTTAFTGTAIEADQPQRSGADITLPDERQLDLFSNEYDG